MELILHRKDYTNAKQVPLTVSNPNTKEIDIFTSTYISHVEAESLMKKNCFCPNVS